VKLFRANHLRTMPKGCKLRHMSTATATAVRADLEPTNGEVIGESYADRIILRSNGEVVVSALVPFEWNGRQVTAAAHELAAANGMTVVGWGR